MPDFLKSDEKKVEYVELIYDLIFVYMIGRNNSLVTHVPGGFIDYGLYLTYVLCTLITIQIWYLTTLFINRYGSNRPSEYICLFINMFLLYYMGDGTSAEWSGSFYKYNFAWLLIIFNLLIQYIIKYRSASTAAPWEKANIAFFIRLLSTIAFLIAVGIALYKPLGIALTPVAMVAGIIITAAGRSKLDLVAVDFPHLSERIMLYVVFTFGEMIVAIASYFSGPVTLNGTYYSAMIFLIVVGLFMSYGFLYDHLIDREMHISGNSYMLIHIFIIFALNNLTLAFEFMREEEVPVIPKTVFLTLSFVIYYLFIFMLVPFTIGYDRKLTSFRWFGITLAAFIVLMAITYNAPFLSIAISVALTFVIWYFEYSYRKHLHDDRGI
ncbi:MAG: hypothetical protein E7220_00120 [Clostridiales bacterium]|nr:hypothetical protein [Clostridiales bacterium]